MYKQSVWLGCCILLSLLVGGCNRPATQTIHKMNDTIRWKKLPDLPGTADTASLGVSAPFAGIHNGQLIVAGGCNFPDKPVTEGGVKRYYEEIFILDLSTAKQDTFTTQQDPSATAEAQSDDLATSAVAGSASTTGFSLDSNSTPDSSSGPSSVLASDSSPLTASSLTSQETHTATGWTEAGKLPYPVAYGASVSTPWGVVCIGGNNSDSSLVRVACLSWNVTEKKIETRLLPSLPAPMDNLAAAFSGSCVYIAGGNENGHPCHTFLYLDLASPQTGWQRLPDFPGPARVQPVLAAQQSPEGKKIYLTGGFQPSDGDKAALVPTDVWAFLPETQTWTEETLLPPFENGMSRTFTGGCCVALGDSSLLFIGGVNYDRFLAAVDRPRQLAAARASGNRLLEDSLQAEAKAYMHHPVEWYRFNTSLLHYNTYTKEWTSLGEYEPLARAGAGAIMDTDRLIIINGELKPGIRTPQVNQATL